MRFPLLLYFVILSFIISPVILFAQRNSKSSVCNRECSSNYICGFGEFEQQSSKNSDIINAKKQANNAARIAFASRIIIFVESTTELNIKEQDGNAEELYELSAKFETRFKEENVRIDGPFECTDRLWMARAIKKQDEVYREIYISNQEKQEKAEEYLNLSREAESYHEKIENLFFAFVYNKSQFKSNTLYKGKRIYTDNSPEIKNEITDIRNSLKIKINAPSSLVLNESFNGEIDIRLTSKSKSENETGFHSIILQAELSKGLVTTEENYWGETRHASIYIENGKGSITIKEVLSPQNIEINIKLDLTQYDPGDYLFDELGYPRSNRVNPSDVFAGSFERLQKKIRINVISELWEREGKSGYISIYTPEYKKPLEIKINGKGKGKTKNGKFKSDKLPFSFYEIELNTPSASNEKIMPIKEMVKLINSNEQLEINIENMTSFIEFIPVDKEELVEIHIRGRNENKFNTKVFFQGRIDETRLDRNFINYTSINPNTIELNSGTYDIFLIKEGEQTTALYKRSLAWAGANRKISLQIKKPTLSKKMYEFIPFVKPYICNQSENNKLIKTSLLATMSLLAYNSFSKLMNTEKTYFSNKKQYESLRDVEQSVIDDMRSTVKTAHSDYSSANDRFNYLSIGLGIAYVYTITF